MKRPTARDYSAASAIGGVLLHTGLVHTTLADGIHVLPIRALRA